jgi:transposase-like protein
MHERLQSDTVTAVAPPVCPTCGSKKVSTTSKRVDASTYWRCGTCGEIWNVERSRGGHSFRWR